MTLLNSERKPSSYLNKGRRRVYATQIWVTQIGLYCPWGHNEIFGQEAGGNLKRQTGRAAPRKALWLFFSVKWDDDKARTSSSRPLRSWKQMSHHLETCTVNPRDFCKVIPSTWKSVNSTLLCLLICEATVVYIPTLRLMVPKHNDESMLNYRWSLIWLKWGVWRFRQSSKRAVTVFNQICRRSPESLAYQSVICAENLLILFC